MQTDLRDVRRKTVPSALADAYQLIDPDLEEVTRLLQKTLRHAVPELDEVIRYSFELGGKRLRPVLVLLSAYACGCCTPNHQLAATALELIHTGTLVHDDILDGAHLRRHLATIHTRWDSKSAVLVGDYLLIQAIELITKCEDLEAYRLIAIACRETCEGELLQTRTCSHFDITLDEYLQSIGGKTAALLRCCCELGAHFASADEERFQRFSHFGYTLGLAFQIMDDILDITGTEEKMGKTLCTDLLNQKPTLPILFYLQEADPASRATFLELLNGTESDAETIQEIRTRLISSGSIEKARAKAESLLIKAYQDLVGPEREDEQTSVQKAACQALHDIAQFVIARNC